MKHIILLDTAFPYEKVEPFLESEISYYPQNVKVYIATCLLKDDSNARKIENENVSLLGLNRNIHNVHLRKLLKFWQAIFVIRNKYFFQEIRKLIADKRLNFRTFQSLTLFLSEGDRLFRKIKKLVAKLNIDNNDILFYSYWMHVHSYVAVRLKEVFPGSSAITRCHGYDLYEYRSTDGYIPMRHYILPRLDKIYTISKDGMDYLNCKYNNISKNIEIARLGTKDCGINPYNAKSLFNIVSCSWMVPIKRIDRIIEALAKIKDIEIKWTHFGNGVMYDEIKQQANDKLPKNILFNMPGGVSNINILEYYKNNSVGIFINVSEHEGIPVSIMEAISFGIPIIATNVGGVSEIVKDRYNGLLLEKDFTDEDLIIAIRKFFNMEKAKYNKYRANAREYWNMNYNADNTYSSFVDKILKT